MSFYSLVGFVTLFVLFLCISDVESMWTLKNVAAKRGRPVTIPCLYDERYKTNHKFWCKGYFWSSCSVVAYANTTGSTAVTDHPVQNMFTVQMNPVSDSGYYWCAAEIDRNWDRDYLYLTVSENPDLSVERGRVSGAEGGSVTVQCLYSAAYRNTQKQWCRFKDRSCDTVGKTDTSQNSAVHISDDGKGSFSVEIRGLKKSDAGWYWCSAGDLQVPVHISVGGEAPGLPEHQQDNKLTASGSSVMALCLIFGLLLVLVLLGWVIWKYKQNHIGLLVTDRGCNRSLGLKKPRENAVTYGSGVDRQCTASSASEPDVTYSTVKISPHPSVTPVPRNDNVIYSSVKR